MQFLIYQDTLSLNVTFSTSYRLLGYGIKLDGVQTIYQCIDFQADTGDSFEKWLICGLTSAIGRYCIKPAHQSMKPMISTAIYSGRTTLTIELNFHYVRPLLWNRLILYSHIVKYSKLPIFPHFTRWDCSTDCLYIRGPFHAFFLKQIEIWWKLHFTVTPFLAIMSLQNFAHVITAQLSCYTKFHCSSIKFPFN